MAKSKHTFIVNTNEINRYGFRILSEGIDTTNYDNNPVLLYMHKREEVIGRGEDLVKLKGGDMTFIPYFDSEDPHAAKIERKVDDNILRMSSINVDNVVWSDAPEHLLPGQTKPTVISCSLREISIVDIGGHQGALKMSAADGSQISLADIPDIQLSDNNELNKKTGMKELEKFVLAIALAFGMDEDSTQKQVEAKAKKIAKDKDTAEKSLKLFLDAQKTAQAAEAVAYVDKAIKLNLVPDTLKTVTLSAFEGNHTEQKTAFDAMFAAHDAKNADDVDENNGIKLSAETTAFLADVGKSDAAKKREGEVKMTYDELQKTDPIKLAWIRDNQPEDFQKLVDGYNPA